MHIICALRLILVFFSVDAETACLPCKSLGSALSAGYRGRGGGVTPCSMRFRPARTKKIMSTNDSKSVCVRLMMTCSRRSQLVCVYPSLNVDKKTPSIERPPKIGTDSGEGMF